VLTVILFWNPCFFAIEVHEHHVRKQDDATPQHVAAITPEGDVQIMSYQPVARKEDDASTPHVAAITPEGDVQTMSYQSVARVPGPLQRKEAVRTETSLAPHRIKGLLSSSPWWIELFWVLGLSALSGIVVVAVVKFGDFVGWACTYSGDDLKLREFAAQQETTRAIEEALAAAKKDAIAAAKKAAVEVGASAEEPGAAGADDDDAELVLSHDELIGSMLHSTAEAEMQAAQVVANVKKQTDWAVKRVALVQDVVDTERLSVKGRVEDFAIKELSNLMFKLDSAMQQSTQSAVTASEALSGLRDAADDVRSTLMGQTTTRALDKLTKLVTNKNLNRDFRQQVIEEIQPNPLSILIAGALAPTQLQLILFSSQFCIMYNGVVLATALSISVLHASVPCGEQLVWIWLYTLVCTNVTVVVSASIYRTWCGKALEIVRAEQAKFKDVVIDTGSPLLDAFTRIQTGVSIFVKSAYLYSGISVSSFASLGKLASFAGTLNGAFGIIISMVYVREHTKCAQSLIAFLHVYSLVYLIFLSFTLVSFAVFLVSQCARTPCVNDTLLNAAYSWDKENPGQFPIFSTLARAFLVTGSRQVLGMKRAAARAEIYDLDEDIKSLTKRLWTAKRSREVAQKSRQLAEVKEADMLNKYKAKLATVPQEGTIAVEGQGGHAVAETSSVNDTAAASSS
jgi:hypothetical protein